MKPHLEGYAEASWDEQRELQETCWLPCHPHLWGAPGFVVHWYHPAWPSTICRSPGAVSPSPGRVLGGEEFCKHINAYICLYVFDIFTRVNVWSGQWVFILLFEGNTLVSGLCKVVCSAMVWGGFFVFCFFLIKNKYISCFFPLQAEEARSSYGWRRPSRWGGNTTWATFEEIALLFVRISESWCWSLWEH